MDRERELKIIRRAYAKQVTAAAGVGDPQVEAAFAAVAREDFLGPGPWHIVRWGGGYRATPDADPVYLYTDDVIGILPKRNLNNGQPSLHAALIAAAAPQPGEHVVHIGAGVGYYTAILAELVGATGRVTAIEYDAELAARATANLAQTPHVRVVHGDGTQIAFAPRGARPAGANAIRRLPSPRNTRTCGVCAKFRRRAGGELGIVFESSSPPRGADQLGNCRVIATPAPICRTCSPGWGAAAAISAA